MPRIKILPNSNHYGIDAAVNCCVLARKVHGANVYKVLRKDLVALGADPYSDNKVIRFIGGKECKVVSLWQTFKEWASGTVE